MQNLWHNMAPFATDTSGAMTLFQHAPSLVVAQDGNGSVSTLRRVIDIYDCAADFETIDLAEISYTLGREQDFQQRLLELVDHSRSHVRGRVGQQLEFVVLVGGPVSSLLGQDLSARARELERSCGLRVLTVETTGNSYYDKGLSRAYLSMYEQLVNVQDAHAERARKADDKASQRAKTYSIIGLSELDYPGTSVVSTLAQDFDARGELVVTDFGYSDSWDRWAGVAEADEVIVASISGLRLARALREEFGIPFTRFDELRCFDSFSEGLSFERHPSVLIVGEQVSSNLVRRLLKNMGASRVNVASFFTMDRALSRSSDVKLKSERDLETLIESGAYGIVIGDPIFSRLCDVPFFALMHPPSGFGARSGEHLSRAWCEAIVKFCAGLRHEP